MKRFLVLLTGLFLLVALPMPAAAEFTKNKVAVLDFQLQGEGFETKDMGSIVAEWFITALVKTGRFDVVERAMLKKILNEQKMGLSGAIDEKTATKLGKILGVKVIISGSVMKLQEILEVNARIIDVETASIIAAENVKATASTSLQSLIVQMSEKIIKNFPLEGYVVSRDGSAVTIDLGKLAGVKTDMEFMAFKEGKIIKHPKTGEVLDVEKIQTGTIKITKISDRIATGQVANEESGNAIAVGQMVKSTSGPLTPLEVSTVYTGTGYNTESAGGGRAARAERAPRAPKAERAPREAPSTPIASPGEFVAKIRSGNYEDKEFAAKRIVKEGVTDTAVLDALNKDLLAIYNLTPRDRSKCDSIAWMVKALGSSANPKYKDTIAKIANEADNDTVKKWAKKTLAAY
ncbi:MAG: hypothetical protein HGA96_15720 [Desulfobulbaceae bacterium]|nr:hypothetical protein [Desulfobulbaceae bacterium]